MATSGNNSPTNVTDTINPNSQTLFTINMTSVSKLTSTNYLMWNLQVHALLDGYDLLGHLDGSILVLPSTLTEGDVTSVNPAYTIWKRQDKLISSSLIGAISTTIQHIVSRATTAAEVWQTLALTYAKPSRGHVRQLKLQLKQWKKDTKTIDVYLQEITTRLDQLAILGKPMDHEDQIELILDGLIDDYKSVVDQVEGRDGPPTITELHERLLNHEVKLLLAPDNSVTHVPATANAVQHRQNNHSQNQNQVRPNNPPGGYGQSSQNQWQPQPQSNWQSQNRGPRPYLGKC